jgi:hypothetical protein
VELGGKDSGGTALKNIPETYSVFGLSQVGKIYTYWVAYDIVSGDFCPVF